MQPVCKFVRLLTLCAAAADVKTTYDCERILGGISADRFVVADGWEGHKRKLLIWRGRVKKVNLEKNTALVYFYQGNETSTYSLEQLHLSYESAVATLKQIKKTRKQK